MSSEELKGYLDARRFAKQLGGEIAGKIQVGMSERDVEKLAGEVFRSHQVNQYFHMPVIGVGGGTAKLRSGLTIVGGIINRYFRKVKEDDLIMIDIAPVHNGYPGDYTTMHIVGRNPELEEFISYARNVAYEVAENIKYEMPVKDVFENGKEIIKSDLKYTLAFPPLISMGHILCRIPSLWMRLPEPGLYYLLGKGGSFINSGNKTLMKGLWVIEPYLLHNNYGAKFEVLLYVDEKLELLD